MTNYLTINDNSLSSYFLEINRFPVLSAKEEYELAIKYYNENDLDSAHRLIVSNLRFVVKIAFEYKHYGLQLIDLIQEGNIGLMKAVKKFNPHKGIKLISYAVWWIKAYINKYIMENWSLIKIGTTQLQRKLFYKAKQIENDSFENKELEEMSQRMYK